MGVYLQCKNRHYILLIILVTSITISLYSEKWWVEKEHNCFQPISNCTCLYNSNQSLISPHNSTLVPLSKLKHKENIEQIKRTKGVALLDKFSLVRFYECPVSKTAKAFQERSQQTLCYKQRTFLQRNNPLIALASFQGSGNTWVRHLLEQATGINTGSIYCDTTLKAAFPGEFIVSGSVLVVKTHHPDTTELPVEVRPVVKKQHYDKAIIIVRNLYDALVSEANRRWNGKYHAERHLGLAKESVFIGNPKWDWYVEYKGMSWLVFLNTWIKESKIPKLIVQYENLKTNMTHELTRMLRFLEKPITQETLSCVEKNSRGLFKRSRHLNFDPYSSENKKAVNRIIEQSRDILNPYNICYDTR